MKVLVRLTFFAGEYIKHLYMNIHYEFRLSQAHIARRVDLSPTKPREHREQILHMSEQDLPNLYNVNTKYYRVVSYLYIVKSKKCWVCIYLYFYELYYNNR